MTLALPPAPGGPAAEYFAERPAPPGRDREARRLCAFVDGIGRHGGSPGLLVSGEPGAGKSALLEFALGLANGVGVRVRTCSASASEAGMRLAGLHRLVRALLVAAPGLPADLRTLLHAGFVDAEGERFVRGVAVLDLVTAAAADGPLLLVVDDAHWLDAESVAVLGFLLPRLAGEHVGILLAGRTGTVGSAALAGLGADVLTLTGLPQPVAADFLAAEWPDRSESVRAGWLREADGNPLLLTALPGHTGPGLPPRVASAFAGQADGLPSAARALLDLLAFEPEATTSELLAAGGAFRGDPVDAGVLLPALDAGLVVRSAGGVRFADHRVGPALTAVAPASVRHRAHAAWARVLPPARAVEHRAAVGTGPDDALADDVAAAADAAAGRGDTARAARLLRRAVDLGADPVRRGRRLVDLAQLADDAGRRDEAFGLAVEAAALELDPIDRHRIALVPPPGDVARLSEASARSAVHCAERAIDEGDTRRAGALLRQLSEQLRWTTPTPDPRLTELTALVPDPLDHALGALDQGRYADARTLLTDVVVELRRTGRDAVLARALTGRAWASVRLADWASAADDASAAAALAERTSQPLWHASATLAAAAVQGVTGHTATALRTTVRAEQVAHLHAAPTLLAQALAVRGTALLTAGRYGQAYDTLTRLADPADPARHPGYARSTLADLADAALRLRRRAAPLTGLPESELPPLARALVASDAAAEQHFRAALAAHTADPFTSARLHLNYGEWLRRRRRVAESRALLGTALATFEALGLEFWAERARGELRGSGVGGAGAPAGRDAGLTPTELRIARLAARGQSNRQIGQQLYLSPRTVGSHLYRIYPKLGIASRVQLHAALADLDDTVEGSARRSA